MTSLRKNLEFEQGTTFSMVLRWATNPIVYVPIVGIEKTAPVRILVPTAGIPDGWGCAVVGGRGMDELKAVPNKVTDADYRSATIVDGNTLEFNSVNAADFKDYIGGAHLQYRTPVDLDGYSATLAIKNRIGGTLLMTLSDVNSKIVLNNVDKTIRIHVSAEELAAQEWVKGVYMLEMSHPTKGTFKPMYGSATVAKEVM